MRVLFLGSGAFGLPTLEALMADHTVVGVVSQPARPAGRKRKATPTPVAAYAETMAVPLRCTPDANMDDTAAWADALKPEATVVVAFGQKLQSNLLARLGPFVVNLHASLLPRYRGAAPINWALLRGETETGVSVISIAERMDAGLVYARRRTPIQSDETAGQLHDRLAVLGPEAIAEVLAAAAVGKLVGEVQDEAHVTRAPKLSKADGNVTFDATPAAVRCRIHGLTPWPAARVTWERRDLGTAMTLTLHRVVECDSPIGEAAPGTVLDGHRIAVRGGAVRLLEVQAPGKRPMAIDAFVRGTPMSPGDRLVGEEKR